VGNKTSSGIQQMTAIAFFVIGLLGWAGHWLKRYLAGQTPNDLVCYLFHCQPKATARSFLTFFTSWFAFMAAGHPELSWGTAWGAFCTGYLIDSALNRE
jgi:hypothetical protein